MLETIKNNKLVILLGIIICIILYLTQSYHKKSEEFKLNIKKELELSQKESLKYKEMSEKLSLDITKLKEEVKKKNKNVHVIVKKNADGSSVKEITMNENSEESNKQLDQNSLKVDKNLVELDKQKQLDLSYKFQIQEETRKEEIKKNNNTLLWMGGLLGACIILKKCKFDF